MAHQNNVSGSTKTHTRLARVDAVCISDESIAAFCLGSLWVGLFFLTSTPTPRA